MVTGEFRIETEGDLGTQRTFGSIVESNKIQMVTAKSVKVDSKKDKSKQDSNDDVEVKQTMVMVPLDQEPSLNSRKLLENGQANGVSSELMKSDRDEYQLQDK